MRTVAGKVLKFLIDTGAAKNYIKPLKDLQGVVAVEAPFIVKSLHGFNKVERKCSLTIFGVKSPFFILPELATFDGIIGLDTLTEAGASIDLKSKKLHLARGSENILFHKCPSVNFTRVNDIVVPPAVKEAFINMMAIRIKAFADPEEILPFNTAVVATIKTEDDEPVYSRMYPFPVGSTDFVNEEVKELLKNQIIRPSRSPYNNPIWVVGKKGLDDTGASKKRLVIDFRKLNAKTVADRYPMPSISMILSNLGKAKYFTTLDLKSGYHQITLAERDREKTSFSVNGGKYEFCRLPFGLRNASSIFQRAIDDVLREHIGKICYVYVDDVIVFSRSKDEHVKDIDSILESLYVANMRVSREKSQFFKESVEFLGFVVSTEGTRTSPDKVKSIQDFRQPSTLFEVRSFLGLASYYRCFIKGFAQIARPITNILKGENGKVSKQRSKSICVEFDETQKQAFDKLRNILAPEDVILHYPDFSLPFDLTTDASSTGIGAVLSQKKPSHHNDFEDLKRQRD